MVKFYMPLCCALAVASHFAFASEIEVADADRVTLSSATPKIRAVVPAQDSSYPAAVGTPQFWLDCSDTNGWEFTTYSGQKCVVKVPSKVGSALAGVRYLTTTPGGGDWEKWGTVAVRPPRYVEDESVLGGAAYLDFIGSYRALVFNPVCISAGDTEMTNALANIGTVIAVRGSRNGDGGHFLGGGIFMDYGWHRAGNPVTGASEAAGTYYWWNRIVNTHAQSPVYNAYLWQDGVLTLPRSASYNGDWQVMTLACASAGASAHGIGCNDRRSNMGHVAGGAEIAEMLIYDRVLTREESERVEMYLEAKWMNRGRTGWNGSARIAELNIPSSGLAAEVEVPGGVSLQIDRISGGRAAGSSLTKTGSGDLVFEGEGVSCYNGEVCLREGALSFPRLRAVPTADGLPPRLYARFDASELESFSSLDTTSSPGVAKVRAWENLSVEDNAYAFNRRFRLMSRRASVHPSLVYDALGSGLNVVDFGQNVASTGPILTITTNETYTATPYQNMLYGVCTVVALVGAQNGGGNLCGTTSFYRETQGTTDMRTALLAESLVTTPSVSSADTVCWMNGSEWNVTNGYASAGYQVVAFQTTGSSFGDIFRDKDGKYSGGARLGEMLIWNRVLTEREILDAQAYLMRKWLGRSAPGYERTEGEFAVQDVQRLTVPSGADVSIHVAAGRTVRVGRVEAAGVLSKTGGGSLEIGEMVYASDESRLNIQDGEADVVGVRDAESASACARGASLHLDASDESSMLLLTRSADGAECLQAWMTKSGNVCARNANGSSNLTRAPHIRRNALNGMPAVDFGRWGSGSANTNSPGGGTYMALDRALRSMRSIYAVINYHDRNLGFLFGSTKGHPCYDSDDITFHPAFDGSGQFNGGFMYGYGFQEVFKKNIFTNSVAITTAPLLAFPMVTNEFILLELHSSSGVGGGQIGRDRVDANRIGGFEIAELIVYERELSEREKTATRNYLNAKWFGRAAEALPDAPEPTPLYSRFAITVGEGGMLMDTDEDVSVVTVDGAGTMVKKGDGELAVTDISALEGALEVREGTVTLKGSDVAVVPELASAGIVFHADATKGVTATANSSGVVCVSRWESQTDNGYYAERSGGSEDMQRIIRDPGVGLKPTVDMDGYNACFMWKDRDGNDLVLSGIRSVFWMLGSHNGGGFLLGGGTNSSGQLSYGWHRGIHWVTNPETGAQKAIVGSTNVCNVLHTGADACLRNALWHMNGKKINPTSTHLSGGWDQLSMTVADESVAANASGFAFDGRSRKATGSSNHDYNGHQRLAEVIVYNRVVTEEERVGIEAYLNCKWHRGVHPAATNLAVAVGEGATLVLEGPQSFASLSGAGTVEGDTSAYALIADAASDGLVVGGVYTIRPATRVELAGLDSWDGKTDIPVLTASEYEGTEALSSAVFAGETPPAGFVPRLCIRSGGLVVRNAARGTRIILR